MPEAREEIKIGNNNISMNTEIRINLKTLCILLGILLPSITGLYWKISSEISAIGTEVSGVKTEMLVIQTNQTNTITNVTRIDKNVTELSTKLIPTSVPTNTWADNLSPE